MRRSTSVLLAGSVLGALGIAVFSSVPSIAEFAGGGGNPQVDIISAPRLDTNVTNEFVPVSGPAGARLTVEALGPGGGSLWVTGISGGPVTTSLTAASLNTLLHPPCTQGLPELVRITPTPRMIPVDGGHADPATTWYVMNLAVNRKLCCMPSFDGGVPTVDCEPPTDGGVGLGYVVPPGYGTLQITGEDFTHDVWCRSDGSMETQTVDVNVWEVSCVQ